LEYADSHAFLWRESTYADPKGEIPLYIEKKMVALIQLGPGQSIFVEEETDAKSNPPESSA
jgi:hypothetical protein